MIIAGLVGFGSLLSPHAHAADRPNVLFIVLDDLNGWVGHLGGHPQARTPNIDRLAAAGLAFTSAYAPAPACNPARAAVMSGLRPFESGLYWNEQDWTRALGVETTLTARFISAGYGVFGAGKIFHDSIFRDGEWTEHFLPPERALAAAPGARDEGVGGIRFRPVANPPQDLPDYATVSWSIAKLQQRHDRPFFLAVGLTKPHMPWAVPQRYFDRFPLASIELPPHLDGDLDDVPAVARPPRAARDHERILRSGRWKEAVQAYLAATAFADEQVGRLLDALEASPHHDDTIVVLWGDNGFHLGEKGRWRKFTLWEEATRVPLVWVVPGVTRPGGVSPRAVDLSSLYPTLCELAGIERPEQVRTPSLVPLLRSPEAAWEHPALMTLEPGSSAVRFDRWRYIRYADGSEELYDHASDPNEWRNLAAQPTLAGTRASLAKRLPQAYATPVAVTGGRDGLWFLLGAILLLAAAALALRRMAQRRGRGG